MKTLILRIRHLLPFVLLLSFVAAYVVPGVGDSNIVATVLTVAGILFAICVGFFITDLWGRFENIRSNVAVEVSGLITYFRYVLLLGKRHGAFIEKQVSLINRYARKFISVEWHEYYKTDEEFGEIFKSLEGIKELKTSKEAETFTNMLAILTSVSEARKKMTILGQDRLSKAEWTVVFALSLTLIFCLFYLKEPTATSIVFTGLLTAVTFLLILILNDLNDLSYGEETVSFEPYERIFDIIGKPRYYLKKDVQNKRITLPKDKRYELG